MDASLQALCSPGALAEPGSGDALRLSIPPGPARAYRIAQMDDYRGRARRSFPWRPPLELSLEARAGRDGLPGTWGFGFWNAPLSLSIGFGGNSVLPALPNATWFFYASPENYLSLRDDLPANGFRAQTFRSPHLPMLLLSPAAVLLPLLLVRPAARVLRRWAGRLLVREDTAALGDIDPARWHRYSLNWDADRVRFTVDGQRVHQTGISPHGPLGLVLWIDNQYARFTPQGRLGFGTLPSPDAGRLEIRHLAIRTP